MAGSHQTQDQDVCDEQRVDKWLWFARVIKTRTQAAQLVTDGKVRINKQRTDKPSQSLKPGDVVTVTVRGHVRVLRVLAPGERRGPAVEARTLFEEISDTRTPATGDIVATRGANDARPQTRAPTVSTVTRLRGSGRPTKRDRRLTDKLTDGSG